MKNKTLTPYQRTKIWRKNNPDKLKKQARRHYFLHSTLILENKRRNYHLSKKEQFDESEKNKEN